MIADNHRLQNFTGLEKLVAIGITPPESAFSGLSITRNKQLTDLRGLDSLVSIGGQAGIVDNPRLTSLTGLEKLANVNMLQGKGLALHVEHNWRLQVCFLSCYMQRLILMVVAGIVCSLLQALTTYSDGFAFRIFKCGITLNMHHPKNASHEPPTCQYCFSKK